MNELKMSLFLVPISPMKNKVTRRIIKSATLNLYKTMTLQEMHLHTEKLTKYMVTLYSARLIKRVFID